MLKARGVEIAIRHLNNSAGLMNFDNHYEMVRAGIVALERGDNTINDETKEKGEFNYGKNVL